MIMSRFTLLCKVLVLAGFLFYVNPLLSSEGNNWIGDAGARSNIQLLWKQAEVMCGPQSLWQIAHVYGKTYSLNAIASMAGTDLQCGTTVQGMLDACKKIGLPAEAVKTNLRRLVSDSRVAILLLDTDDIMHYVILDRIGEDEVRLLDANKFRNLSFKEFQSMWNGYAILIGHHEGQRADCARLYLGTDSYTYFQQSGNKSNLYEI